MLMEIWTLAITRKKSKCAFDENFYGHFSLPDESKKNMTETSESEAGIDRVANSYISTKL